MPTRIKAFNWRGLMLEDSSLNSQAKFIGLYLSTFMNGDNEMAWPSLKRIQCETGLSKNTVIKYLGELNATGWLITKKQSYHIQTLGGAQACNEYWINIPDKVVRDLTPLIQGGSPGDQRGFISETKGVHDVNPNNNIITNNNKRGRFTPPSLQEVTDYCNERNNNVDPETFIAFYESKGWVVGKAKMKSWKSSVITWEKREGSPTEDQYRGAI